MELREVMRSTPATREFTDEPVDDATLHDLLDTARFAPSGGNRQGWRVIVLQDPEVRRRVRDLYVLGWREYTAHMREGLVPFAPLDGGRWSGPAVDLEEARRTPAPLPFADHLDEVPVLLLLVVELSALAVTDNGLDRQSIVGGASVYPFAHNVLLAARDRGLGGVMTTVLARQEPAVKELLGIPDGHGIAGLLALGHPSKRITKLRRAEVAEFTAVDRFDGRPFSYPRPVDPLAIAEGLLAQPTAPYHEELPARYCLDFAGERGISADRDAAGNVVLRSGPADAERPLVLVAHLDHPGFSVDAADGDVLTLTFHGGVSAGNATGGDPLDFFRPGEHEPIGRGALVAAEETAGRLTGAVAEVLDGEAAVGGFAMWGFPSWSLEHGRITSRVCDDLLGAAAILACLDRVAGTGTSVWGLLTRAEEVGFLGALEAIRLGTVPAGSSVLSLECSKALPDAPQGGGVIVRVGDRMSVFAPALTESLRVAAQQVGNRDETFRFQRKLMDGGACEATAFCASGYRASGLAVPLGNYHNVADDGSGIGPEHVLVDDWLAEVRLLVELASEPGLLDEASPEPPQWLQERAVIARDALGAA